MEHHVKNHAQAPDIALKIENAFPHTLWTLIRIEGNFLLGIFFIFTSLPRITEPTNFDYFIFDQQARKLQISMNKSFLAEIQKAIDDIFEVN